MEASISRSIHAPFDKVMSYMRGTKCKLAGAGLHGFFDREMLVVMLSVLCCALIAYGRLMLRTTIVFTHFAYLPIALTGIWWGRKSVWVAVFLGAFMICTKPFIIDGEPLTADFIRALFFFAVAFCVGTVSDKAKAARIAEQESERELEAAQNQLVSSERLASMGQLSAAVAHEINNPLGTVLIYSHILLNEFDETDKRREDVEIIVSEATRCKNIVHDLLDFARKSRISEPA